jgi:hypothetical protein
MSKVYAEGYSCAARKAMAGSSLLVSANYNHPPASRRIYKGQRRCADRSQALVCAFIRRNSAALPAFALKKHATAVVATSEE